METTLIVSLAAIAVVVGSAAVARVAAARIGQSLVIAEIIVGILLGPSLLGMLFPTVYHGLFTTHTLGLLGTLSQIGLVLFLFQIGLDLDLSAIGKGRKMAIVGVAITGIAASFAIGFLLASVSAHVLAPHVYKLGYEWFFGTALSITALPVLSRILWELRLERHELGAFGISAAALSDVIGWTLLAATIGVARLESGASVMLLQLAEMAALLAVSWYVVRPALRAIVSRWMGSGDVLSQTLIAAIIVVIFVFSITTISIGVFAGIGGFLAGLLLSQQRTFVDAWRRKFDDFLSVFFLPMFFTFTGLRTDIGGLNSVQLWLWCGAVLLAGSVGKLGITYLVARRWGMSRRDAGALGFMMNTRGLVELIVLNIGLDLHMIPPTVFTMLVIMAVVSTAITPPALRLLLASLRQTEPLRAAPLLGETA